MELYAFYALLAGIGLMMLAWLWLVVIAFTVRRAWGFGTLFFPPNALIFVPMHWSRAAPPVALFLVALLPLTWSWRTLYHINMGPYSRVVDGEPHLTLTGWNGVDYSLLAERPDVVVLQMANPDVTDTTLRHLEGMSKLRELDLERTKITDAGLVHLAGLKNLRDIRVRFTAVTDEGFKKHLAGLESLKNIDARNTKITRKTLNEWMKAEPGNTRNFMK